VLKPVVEMSKEISFKRIYQANNFSFSVSRNAFKEGIFLKLLVIIIQEAKSKAVEALAKSSSKRFN